MLNKHSIAKILAYKQLSWSPLDIAKQMGLPVKEVEKVVGKDGARYEAELGGYNAYACSRRFRGKQLKPKKCAQCGSLYHTAYCMPCVAALNHSDLRA